MKKYEQLGKKLTREEQKAVGGGFTQVANTMCSCDGINFFPLCGNSCNDVYGQCSTICAGYTPTYGKCIFAGACW
jgi:hypothetical protein